MLCGSMFLPSELAAEAAAMPFAEARRGRVLETTATPPAAEGQRPSERNPGQAVLDKLTARESEVLTLVSRGLNNKLVARELGLSEHTIKLHMHHILRKLGVSNRTGASMWYFAQSK
ncbi:response regulator transcription factor [Histidinibacterium aquaticum]|uniref:Response regulator transcription factor n=2 Tax=Histidinibacterium aquaticum TaxID=2613962 RepID=A0A5J5GRK1_9RHOB|nr:response regulator transcription factor [Histidinibacterium aquaticum]